MNRAPHSRDSTGIRWTARSLASPIEGDAAENEDNYLVIDGDGQAECLFDQRRRALRVANWPRHHRRFAILDGLGGHGHGRELAEAIVAELLEMPPMRDASSLDRALDALHTRIQSRFAATSPAPGATLLLLEVSPQGSALLYHVGDSRLFALRPGGLELLTVDHSPPTAYALRGLISADEWRHQVLVENRRAISQAFGLGSSLLSPGVLGPNLTELTPDCLPPFLAHLPDRRILVLEPGVTYLMATDGLWSFRQPLDFLGEIARLMQRGDVRDLDRLADLVLMAHGFRSRQEPFCDNTTFIALRAK